MAGENVGVYGINQGGLGLVSGNYDLAYQGNNLTITKALLNVIADGKTKVYGDADPSLTYQVSGLKNGDTAGAVLNSGSLSRVAGENVGVYGINHGCGGLWTTDTGSPIVIRGKDKLAEHAVWSLKCFPDWEWYNINIFGTDDPNHFWVECDGHGKILFPGYPEGYYENHFLHSFELEDGKIKRNRAVCKKLHNFQCSSHENRQRIFGFPQ